MKIAFDIGGLISRYPDQMRTLMQALEAGGVEVHVMTDMNRQDAITALTSNGFDFVPPDRIHSCDWSLHGDLCKTKAMESLGIDILIDDRPDYCAFGGFIGLVLSPRPNVDYYHPSWNKGGLPAVMVPPDELEAFQAWKAQRKGQA